MFEAVWLFADSLQTTFYEARHIAVWAAVRRACERESTIDLRCALRRAMAYAAAVKASVAVPSHAWRVADVLEKAARGFVHAADAPDHVVREQLVHTYWTALDGVAGADARVPGDDADDEYRTFVA